MNRESAQPSIKSRASLMGKLEDFIVNDQEAPDAAVCHDCGAVLINGSWHWMARPPHDAAKTTCLACQKIHDKQPAGILTIQGKFSREHSDELLALIRNIELEKKAENPLQRIMSIDKRSEKLSIATTDAQLARGIGKTLQHQYKGGLDFNYHKGDSVLRVLWQR